MDFRIKIKDYPRQRRSSLSSEEQDEYEPKAGDDINREKKNTYDHEKKDEWK